MIRFAPANLAPIATANPEQEIQSMIQEKGFKSTLRVQTEWVSMECKLFLNLLTHCPHSPDGNT